MTWRPTNPNLWTRHGRTQQMDSSNLAGDWAQRTHDLAVDEPEPADSAWPNPADGLSSEYPELLNVLAWFLNFPLLLIAFSMVF